MERPRITSAVCVGCGTALYWCGAHEEWVDRRHRKSHDDDGHRVKHAPVAGGRDR